MKKTMLALVVLTTIMITSDAQVRFGVHAGIAVSNVDLKIDGDEESVDSRVGPTLGILADVPINENFVFQPALNFVQKGGNQEESGGGITYKYTIALSYLEVPMNFMYRSAGGSGSFFVGAGPVVSFGLSGKEKIKISGGGMDEEEEEDLNFGDGDDELKPLELGGNIVVGYELSNGVFIAGNYSMGFSNLANVDTDNNSWKNRYFGIKLGMRFGGSNGTAKK